MILILKVYTYFEWSSIMELINLFPRRIKMSIKYKFPENFWWGSATSGPQSEGDFNKIHKSIFDYWYEVEPEAFFDKVGPDITSNFYNS